MYSYGNHEKNMENKFALQTFAVNDSLSDTVQEMRFLPGSYVFCAGTWEGLIRFYEVQKSYQNLGVFLQHVIQVNEP